MSWIEFSSEWLVAIVALICYRKYSHLPVRTVCYILWIAVLAETGARLWIEMGYDNNHWIYNCYAILFYSFFYKMTYDHIRDRKRKRIVAVLSLVMLGAIALRGLTTPFLTRFMTHTFNVATGILVINVMYYAIDLLKSDVEFVLKERLAAFVFVGYLLFAVSFIPLSPLVFSIWGEGLSRDTVMTLSNIQGIILIAMNSILIFGFIWTKEQR